MRCSRICLLSLAVTSLLSLLAIRHYSFPLMQKIAQPLILFLLWYVPEERHPLIAGEDSTGGEAQERCTPSAVRCADGGGWSVRVCYVRTLYLSLSKISNCAGKPAWRARRQPFDMNCFDDGLLAADCEKPATPSVDLLLGWSIVRFANRIHLRASAAAPPPSNPLVSLTEYDRTVLHIRDTYAGYYHRVANDVLSLFGTLCRLGLGPEVAWSASSKAQGRSRSLLLLMDPFPSRDSYDWVWQLSFAGTDLDIRSYREYGNSSFRPTLKLSNAVVLSGHPRLSSSFGGSVAAPRLRQTPIASIVAMDRCLSAFSPNFHARFGFDAAAASPRAVRVLFVLRQRPEEKAKECSRALTNAREILTAMRRLSNASLTGAHTEHARFSVTAYAPNGREAPLASQLPRYAQADVLVSVHGAGLVNMAFLPPRSTVLEIFPLGFEYELYGQLARAMGHQYFYFRNTHEELHKPCDKATGLDRNKNGRSTLLPGEFLPVLTRAIDAQHRVRPPARRRRKE